MLKRAAGPHQWRLVYPKTWGQWLAKNAFWQESTMHPEAFRSLFVVQGTVSLRLMTSQLKYIVNHTQKLNQVNYIFCGVWIQYFVGDFKGVLWVFKQNFVPYTTKYNFTRCWNFDKLWYVWVMICEDLVRRAPGIIFTSRLWAYDPNLVK